MTASNCAKYDVQHGLIIFKDHSPLKYTKVSQATVFVQIIIRNTRKRLEIYSEFTVKTTENVIDFVLVFSLLTLNIFHTFFSVSIVNFEQVLSLFGDLSDHLVTNTQYSLQFFYPRGKKLLSQ